jgi:hypothetical protein
MESIASPEMMPQHHAERYGVHPPASVDVRYERTMSQYHSTPIVALMAVLLFAMSTVAHAREIDEIDQRLQSLPAEELMALVPDMAQTKAVRWRATAELARRKYAPSAQLLIASLSDDYEAVRGAAAWGLSQIGGKDAQDALLAFLRTSLATRRWGDLTRATEAEKDLPDKRALDLLIQCLTVAKDTGRNYHFRYYAAEALGKIGDPKASLALAQQLDVSVDYSMSRDHLYLTAIRDTKGKEALPLLVDYLDRLVTKMSGEDLRKFPMIGGREARQVQYDVQTYGLTVSALESVTGRKSQQGTREEVMRDWKRWWNEQTSEQGGGHVRWTRGGFTASHRRVQEPEMIDGLLKTT